MRLERAGRGAAHRTERGTGALSVSEHLEKFAVYDARLTLFVQVRASLTRTAEGPGPGLAISRDLAKIMGGDLAVQSATGEGSQFTFTLPAA